MNLYKRQIKPMRHDGYCAMGISSANIPLEDIWYDESKEDELKEKYEKSFEDPFASLVFEERYIEYIGE